MRAKFSLKENANEQFGDMYWYYILPVLYFTSIVLYCYCTLLVLYFTGVVLAKTCRYQDRL